MSSVLDLLSGEQYSGVRYIQHCLVKRVGLLLITDREESHCNQLNESLIWTLSSRLCNTNHANFQILSTVVMAISMTIRDRISMGIHNVLLSEKLG